MISRRSFLKSLITAGVGCAVIPYAPKILHVAEITEAFEKYTYSIADAQTIFREYFDPIIRNMFLADAKVWNTIITESEEKEWTGIVEKRNITLKTDFLNSQSLDGLQRGRQRL